MPSAEQARDALTGFIKRLRRLTPKKLAAFARRSLLSLARRVRESAPGFKAGVAVLLALAAAISPAAFYISLSGSKKSESRFNADAAQVCAVVTSEHGAVKTTAADEGGGLYDLSGLCFARELDFDGNGECELLIAYGASGGYTAEVWGYDGGDFKRLYSKPANISPAAPKAGSWITLYRSKNKFYIGEFDQRDGKSMPLLTLSGGEFTEKLECDYDPARGIYAFDGEINAADFETISLSGISAARAQSMADAASAAVSGFGGGSPAEEKELSAEEQAQLAYSETLSQLVGKYGRPQFTDGKTPFASGVCYAKLKDVDSNGANELIVAYRYTKTTTEKDSRGKTYKTTRPEYRLEVYSASGGTARRIYESDGISSLLGSDSPERFFILKEEDGETQICRNAYTYDERTERIWHGSSRISAPDGNGGYKTIYTAEVDEEYGYRTYRLNGERVYRRDFEKDGYRVPLFCEESDDSSRSGFTIVYLAGGKKHAAEIERLVEQTQKDIDAIL